jgi:hypothetical protein
MGTGLSGDEVREDPFAVTGDRPRQMKERKAIIRFIMPLSIPYLYKIN